MIWAQARGGVIGADGTMPWHLPEDSRHFREVTSGSTVLMGRRTWDSLPARFRPLPGRSNLVLTRDDSWQADGAVRVAAVRDALEKAGGDLWIIGGAQLYRLALGVADTLEITEIDESVPGDTYAPRVDSRWQQTRVDPDAGWHTSKNGMRYRFLTYRRRPTLSAGMATSPSRWRR